MEENKYFKVINRSTSTVVYNLPEIGVRRVFRPEEEKLISAEEITKLSYQPGGYELMANFLKLEDAALKQVGLDVEPEYNMSREEIIDLIKNGSLDRWLDCLDFAPVGVIDLIKELSVSVPLNDVEKRMALKEKIGFDIDKIVANNVADNESETNKNNKPQRRVSVEEQDKKPARRVQENSAEPAKTSKYNVVKRG